MALCHYFVNEHNILIDICVTFILCKKWRLPGSPYYLPLGPPSTTEGSRFVGVKKYEQYD